MTGPEGNFALRAYLDKTGWTHGQLARAVNAVAAEAGARTSYDRTAVAHWLTGTRPRQPVRRYVGEAFSRKLGRLVTPDDLGFPDAKEAAHSCELTLIPRQTDYAATVRQFVRLTRDDLASAGSDPLPKPIYQAGAMAVPAWPRPGVGVPGRLPGKTCLNGPVGSRELAAATAMLSMFRQLQSSFGGGHARLAVVSYLHTDVSDWLVRVTDEQARIALCAVAAAVANVAGFMAFDSLCHGLAQRYFSVAGALAVHGRALDGYALTLANLSVQAGYLGHAGAAKTHAIRALTALERTAGPAAHAGLRAVLLARLAAAEATTNPEAAVRRLPVLRSLAGAASGDSADLGINLGFDLAFFTALVYEAAGRFDTAIDWLKVGAQNCARREYRSRCLAAAGTARLYLRTGRVQAACHAIRSMMDDYHRVRSARLTHALSDVRVQLAAHRGNERVRGMLDQLGAVG